MEKIEKAKKIAESMHRRGLKPWYATEEIKHHGDIAPMDREAMIKLVEEELKKLEDN